jgi:hypothetical protein
MSLALRPSSWQLRIDSVGRRTIDLELIPFPSSAVECVGADPTERTFIGDDENDKWYGKLCERVKSPRICPLLCSIRERDADKDLGSDDKPNWGSADLSSSDPRLWLVAPREAIEELIRQDGLGRRILHLDVDFDGLERTTNENGEGGLIAYRWHDRNERGYERASSVKSYAVAFYSSTMYAEQTSPPPPPSREDLQTILGAVATLIEETRKTKLLIRIACILAAIIAILIWWR